jgi:tetratricopeptide (TPR) repeat protein
MTEASTAPARKTRLIPGRNDACPCGSGKKYKKCCALEPPGVPEDTAGARIGSAGPPDLAPLLAQLKLGRHADVEAAARDLLERHEGSGVLWKLLGAALFSQGKDALPALETAARLLPRDAESQTNLGNVLRARGRLEEAAARHRSAIELQPDYAEAHNNLGSVLRDLTHLDEAAASYRKAIALNPEFLMAHNNLGLALHSLGRPEEAAASFGRVLARKPEFFDSHCHLANCLRDLGRLEEATESFRRAVHLKADHVPALMGLSDTLLALGRFEEAAHGYRIVIGLRPDFADAHNNLGNALRDSGHMGDSAASYRRALDLQPTHAKLHNNLGNALVDLGRIDEAVASYTRALELEPDLLKAHSNLGGALRELGKLDDAETSYQRALAIRADSPEVLTNLGVVQRLQGRADTAETTLRQALDLNPDAVATLNSLADLCADRGQFSEAEALYRRSAAIQPDSAQAWAGMAALRKMSPEDAHWIAQAERIATGPLRPRDRAQLHFAIGKYYDDVRDFEPAFSNYRRANEIAKSYSPVHDRRHLESTFAFIANLYDRKWLERSAVRPAGSSRPIFIVGMPRSGTSLAEQILASHPGVFGAGELAYWKTASLEVGRAELQAGSGHAELARLADGYLRTLSGLSADAVRVVDKMPGNFAHLGMIHAALPGARIIHMRRNPLDTCLSIYFQNFHVAHSYAHDLEDLAHYYTEYEGLMQHWRAILPPQSILEVPYEALVTEPEVWSRKMVEFAGMPWDAACLNFHRTSRRVSTFSKWQVRQKISRSSVERWRNYAQFVGPLMPLNVSAGMLATENPAGSSPLSLRDHISV